MPPAGSLAAVWLLVLPWAWGPPAAAADEDATRLYSHLLANYNRLVRPVRDNTDNVTVKMGLKLSQLVDVNMKHQVMTTNVWVVHEWYDYKLSWDPNKYGGLRTLDVPSESLWLPDIVLYNNADGNYEITSKTKARVHHSGNVEWQPPAVYKSYCQMNVKYFPFDEQNCFLKFGSWTYDEIKLDLQHIKQTRDSDLVNHGINLDSYHLSSEWDIMQVPALRHHEFYSCCEHPYTDIFFNITMRRHTLFYTVHLMVPCVMISCLTVAVFYLPSESGEKITLCISILLSVTVFVLLLAETIPPTSLTVPLLGKYLLFTLILVTLSVVSTVCVLNIGFRSAGTHRMAGWVRVLFLRLLPPLLLMSRPARTDAEPDEPLGPDEPDELFAADEPGVLLPAPSSRYDPVRYGPGPSSLRPAPTSSPSSPSSSSSAEEHRRREEAARRRPAGGAQLDGRLRSAMAGVGNIARHMKNEDAYRFVQADWHYVAKVLDRLFLWIFAVACVAGTCTILLEAPSLYDKTTPIDQLETRAARHSQMGDEEK